MKQGVILEEILAEVGDAGRFQFLFSAAIFGMEMVIAWSMVQAAVVGATPDWWCVDPSTLGLHNMTLDNTTFRTCSPSSSSSSVVGLHDDVYGNITTVRTTSAASVDVTPVSVVPVETCVRYYDTAMVTIVSEWDLVCDRTYIKKIINTAQMAGVFVGAVVAGQLSDSLGRRLSYYVTLATHAVTCLVTGLSVVWQMYAACRFFVGLSIGAFNVLHYVYIIEFVRHTWRPRLSALPTWSMGVMLLCLTAWLLPHWRYLHFILVGLTVPFAFGWFFSPESVRWLAAKGKVAAAEQVIERIAKINGGSKLPDTNAQLVLLSEKEKDHGKDQRQHTYLTLFRSRRSAFMTVIIMFVWLSISMSYYGVTFSVSALSGNVYLNLFLFSLIEIPLAVSTSCITACIGRRWASSLFFLLTSLTGFGILIAALAASEENKGTLITVVAISSKLFLLAGWVCVITYTAELYPTVIRNIGLGAAHAAARFGGVLAPFVVEMETSDDVVRCYVTVGCIMALSGVSILFLSETKGKSLADTLHQEQKQLDF